MKKEGIDRLEVVSEVANDLLILFFSGVRSACGRGGGVGIAGVGGAIIKGKTESKVNSIESPNMIIVIQEWAHLERLSNFFINHSTKSQSKN